MKRNTITTLLLTLVSLVSIGSPVFAAEAISNGSIRVTISPEDEDNLGMRYTTKDDQVETGMKPSEVLSLTSFNINFDDQFLLPKLNEFSMSKVDNLLTIHVKGTEDEQLVRLHSESEASTYELYLPSDIEIATVQPIKVEILDADDVVVAEVTDEVKDYTSVSGMEIRFAVANPEEDQGGEDQGGDNSGDNTDGGDQIDGNLDSAPASGGCSLTAATSPSSFSALLLIAALVTVFRFRVKK